ncbi:MAG: sodium/proline symporter [Gemmatimonadaceae bacterium]|nr:sodium/proline symporter [Gemmatimonadaceae bacterium]
MSRPIVAVQAAALPTFAQPPVIAAMLAFFAATIVIGWWATRRTRTTEDFFVAGQGLGMLTMTIAAMSATLSGFAFIGGPGLVYTIGLAAIYVVLPLSITNAQGAWVLAKRLRLLAEVRPMLTVPDAIGARYRSPAAQGLAGTAIVIAVVGYMATNLLALGLVIDAVFGSGLVPGIWIGALVTLAYSVGGGILAGVYTDLFQGSVMAIASLLVFALVLRVGGGMDGISTSLLAHDAGVIGPWGKSNPLAALSLFFVFGIGTLGQPHVVHKFYMLRDPRRLKWYPVVMTIAMSVTLLLFIGVGLVVKALVLRGDMAPLARADDATPAFLLRFAPVWLAGVVLAGVAAAIMSTVNAFMSVGAAAITHDIPIGLGRSPAQGLRAGRLATLAITLVSTVVAVQSGTLVAFLGIFGWGLFASTLVPALAIGLNWPMATRQGALASITTGLTVTLVLETLAYLRVFTFPSGVTATALALVSSLGVFLVVSWVTRADAPSQIDPDIQAVMDV